MNTTLEVANDFVTVTFNGITNWHNDRIKKEAERFLKRCELIASQKPTDVQILTLEDFWPVSVNELMTASKFERHKLKKQDAEIVAYEAARQHIRKAEGKRIVKATLFYGRKGNRKSGRRGDEDNLCKSLYDSLVQCGLIKDDSSEWCIKEMPTMVEGDIPGSKKRGIVVILEDIPTITEGTNRGENNERE